MTPSNQLTLTSAELAILNNRLEGIAKKMANTLLRTGRSGVLNRARDFSISMVTRDSRLLSSAEALPIHVLIGSDMMSEAMHQFHPELKRGDAFLHNSPYHGNSHAGDHTILVPVIDDNGEHHFTMLSKAHMADIGNSLPITLHAGAKDVYEEGALIFPAVKVQEDYKNIKDIQRMCEMRIRIPEQWRGDFLAMIGAARIGEREMLALAKEVGWERLHAFEEQWFDYSEMRMINAIKQVPAGKATVSSTHDHFPNTPKEGIPICATVEIDPENAIIDVDFRDNPDNLPCGLNLSEACSRTAAMVGIFNSIDHTVPKNAGSFRRVNTHLREGAIVGIPKHPTSCSMATTNIADRATNCVQRAIAEIAGGRGFGMAEVGYPVAPSLAAISGVDPRSGKTFVDMVFLGFSGGAASAHEDCWFSVPHVGNAGMCFQDPVELDELVLPIMVYERRLVPDTEGAGRYRGAPNLLVEYGPVGCAVELGYANDANVHPAYGVCGGLPGGLSAQKKRTCDGNVEDLPNVSLEHFEDGERMISVYCGGGGYGPPHEREPERVLKDCVEEWITPERARSVYGVAITKSGEIDLKETQRMRAKLLKAARLEEESINV